MPFRHSRADHSSAGQSIPVAPGTIRFVGDGRTLLHAAPNRVALLEIASGQPRWTRPLSNADDDPLACEVSLDAKRRHAVVVRGHQRIFGEALLFDLDTGDIKANLFLNTVSPHGWTLSASGRWLAAATGPDEVEIHDLESANPNEPVLKLKCGDTPISALALNANSTRLITAHEDGTCLVWPLDLPHDVPLREDGQLVAALAGTRAADVHRAILVLMSEPRRTVKLLERKLTQGPGTDAGRLFHVRAVELLERIGTPEAVALLQRLVQGSERTLLTGEARDALTRLQNWADTARLQTIGRRAQLGHAGMVCGDGYCRLAVSPDGTWISSPGKWFRLAEGKEMPAPVFLPPGYHVDRFFDDGSYLVFGHEQHLLFNPGTDRPRCVIPDGGYLRFDSRGQIAVKLLRQPDKTVLQRADLKQGDTVKWQTLAVFRPHRPPVRLQGRRTRCQRVRTPRRQATLPCRVEGRGWPG